MPHSSLLNPELFMVQLSPQTDSFIIQPIFWVEILLQPSHSIHHQGSGNGQVKRFACRKHFCQTLLGPGIPSHPLFMAREEAVSSCPPSTVGAGDNSVGLFITVMPTGASRGNLLLLGHDGWVLPGTQTGTRLLHWAWLRAAVEGEGWQGSEF